MWWPTMFPVSGMSQANVPSLCPVSSMPGEEVDDEDLDTGERRQWDGHRKISRPFWVHGSGRIWGSCGLLNSFIHNILLNSFVTGYFSRKVAPVGLPWVLLCFTWRSRGVGEPHCLEVAVHLPYRDLWNVHCLCCASNVLTWRRAEIRGYKGGIHGKPRVLCANPGFMIRSRVNPGIYFRDHSFFKGLEAKGIRIIYI